MEAVIHSAWNGNSSERAGKDRDMEGCIGATQTMRQQVTVWFICAAANSSMDALEDTTEDCLWQWELRDVKAIPKALKPAAKDHKKLMHKVCSLHI